MKRIIINKCHFCGGTEFITVYQSGYASASSTQNILRSTDIYHTICRDCGSIVRSYVKNPEKLLKRSERRKKGEE